MSSQFYHNATIVTVDASRRIITDGALLVTDGRIAAIGKADQVKPPVGVLRVDLQDRIVIPGLINGHVHVIQSLMRGLAENLELHAWASCAIWPLEVSFRGSDGAAAASLAAAEMLKTGTTCFLEPMLPSYDDLDFGSIVQAIGDSGIRACLGKLVKIRRSDPAAGIPDSRDDMLDSMSIEAALEAHGKFHRSHNSRIHVWMAAETPRGQDEAGFAAIGAACAAHDIRLTVHVAEAPRDLQLIREHYHASPVQFCRNIGATGSHVVLGHMVHLEEEDFAILRETNTSVAHNPTSNAKLADGIAPIPRLLREGINVCLGTDGAPCNNSHDLFRDMHLAGILHKGLHADASLLPAEHILEMATIQAARALGIDHDLGSLEVGKMADFVVLDPSGLHAAPYTSTSLLAGGMPTPALIVHSLSGADVCTVVVNGELVVDEGRLTKINEDQIKANAIAAIAAIQKRSLVRAQPLLRGWNYV